MSPRAACAKSVMPMVAIFPSTLQYSWAVFSCGKFAISNEMVKNGNKKFNFNEDKNSYDMAEM